MFQRTALLASLVLAGVVATSARESLIPFEEWHGAVATSRAPHHGLVVRFEKTDAPVWTCWSFPEDWERYEALVIEFDAAADAELGLALSDDDGFLVGIPVSLRKGANGVAVPVRKLFEAGLQVNHMRGIALWARGRPATVTVREVGLTGKGVDLSNVQRFGTRMLADAERVGAEFTWYYTFQAHHVQAVAEHAVGGKRSFRMHLDDKRKVKSWGRIPHDWRGYESVTCEVYNPADVPVSLDLSAWDSHVPFVSERYIARKSFTLPPRRTTTLAWALAGLEGDSIRAPRGRLKMKFIQSLRFERPGAAETARVYVDNIRLVGRPGHAFDGQLAADEIPEFGFEHARNRLKLPIDLKRIDVRGAPALRVGAARVKVTPKLGTRMATGGMNSEAILDDLYVRVLVLQENGKEPIVWLHRDHVFSGGQPTVNAALEERLKIRPGNTFWSATHTHNSGWWGDRTYREGMINAFIKAAEQAHASMQPVRVAVAKTRAKFNYNRNIKGPDGKFPSNLYEVKYLNYLMDSRPVDDELGMIWFVGLDGKPLAGVVSYTGHANMLCRVAPVISGDWAGWTQRLLEGASDAVVMLVNGAEGDVDMRGNGVSIGRTIRAGWDVANAAARVKPVGVEATSKAGVSIRHGTGVGTPSPADRKKKLTERKFTVDVLTIGPVAFVDVRGELWNRFGREIKTKSPFPYTFINMSSGGYFAEEYAFEQELYGTWNRQPDWGGVVRDAALRLLAETETKP